MNHNKSYSKLIIITISVAVLSFTNFCLSSDLPSCVDDIIVNKNTNLTYLFDTKNSDVYKNNKVECIDKWSKLKPNIAPTERQLGYAWVTKKLEELNEEGWDNGDNDDIGDDIPAVFGPNNKYYLVDNHHTLASLDYWGEENNANEKITIHILCDLSSYSIDDFWNYMEENNLVYLYSHPDNYPNSLPRKITYSELPSYFSFTPDDNVFGDDKWRSIVSYSRKVKEAPEPFPECDEDEGDYKFCERCFYRNCTEKSNCNEEDLGALPFFEFRWAYFMLDVTYVNSPSSLLATTDNNNNNNTLDIVNYWPNDESRNAFMEMFSSLPYMNMELVDVDQWQEAANLLIPLCRSESTGDYILPDQSGRNSKSFLGGPLPGYVLGDVKLDKDPECAVAECGSCFSLP